MLRNSRLYTLILSFLFICGILLGYSDVVYGLTRTSVDSLKESPFLYERKHIRNQDLEELSRQIACFWVSREVHFLDNDTLKENSVLPLEKKELDLLNQRFMKKSWNKDELFREGYKIQLKEEVLGGTNGRYYLASATLCVAFREEADGKNSFIIAIRGSLGDTDWTTNLNLEPGLLMDLQGLTRRMMDLNESLYTQNRDYHIGFYKSVELLQPYLMNLSFQRKDGKRATLKELLGNKNMKNGFLICGYSKGAALSQILSMKLATNTLYRKKGDEARNGLCSYNFAGPNVYNGEDKHSAAGKNRKKEEKASRAISLFNINIEGDAINFSDQVYRRKYGESYMVINTLSSTIKLLRMAEIHEEWYRSLLEHLKNGDLGKYQPVSN